MSTVCMAIQMALQPDCVVKILCKIVSMTLYKGRNSDVVIMIVVLCDEVGALIEAVTMNERKVGAFYRNFEPNNEIVLTCLADKLLPHRQDSQSYYRIEGNWSIGKSRVLFDDRNYFLCFVNIDEFRKSRQRANMLAGVLVQQTSGPKHYDSDKRLVANGRYLELRDSQGRDFRALVWECVNEIAAPGYIETFRPGDLVLLPCARELPSSGRSHSSNPFTVTTMHQPVPNSQCVGERVEKALAKIKRKTVAWVGDPRRHRLKQQAASPANASPPTPRAT